MNNLLVRIITGLTGASIVIGAIVWNEIGFVIVFGTIMLLTLREFYTLARKSGNKPFEIWGLILALVSFLVLFSSFNKGFNQDLYWRSAHSVFSGLHLPSSGP